jgi:hypothetical protein
MWAASGSTNKHHSLQLQREQLALRAAAHPTITLARTHTKTDEAQMCRGLQLIFAHDRRETSLMKGLVDIKWATCVFLDVLLLSNSPMHHAVVAHMTMRNGQLRASSKQHMPSRGQREVRKTVLSRCLGNISCEREQRQITT